MDRRWGRGHLFETVCILLGEHAPGPLAASRQGEHVGSFFDWPRRDHIDPAQNRVHVRPAESNRGHACGARSATPRPRLALGLDPELQLVQWDVRIASIEMERWN